MTQPKLPRQPAQWKASFRKRLLAWFDCEKRDLPWRETSDPYAIWISEIMLQQTQVATVVPYFERFLAAFPTVDALAAAPEEQVLRLWEGLGYYRRARNLHRAAQLIVEEHEGAFPTDFKDVLALPGIGRYTAGAILSIALDGRYPILEANTLRLYSRLLAFTGDPRSTEGSRALWSAAEDWLPQKRVGDFNQALMELGSRVCTPQAPDCSGCPVRTLCAAHRKGKQEQIPAPAKKPKIEQVREAAAVVHYRGRVLLVRNGEESRWAGLWDFPRFPVDGEQEAARRKRLADCVAGRTGVAIEVDEHFTTLRHGVTRFRITLECYTARRTGGKIRTGGRDTIRWIRPDEFEELPLSTTGRKLSRLVADACRKSQR